MTTPRISHFRVHRANDVEAIPGLVGMSDANAGTWMSPSKVIP